jgi:hypothetical protein
MKLAGHEEVNEICALSLFINHAGFMVDSVVLDGVFSPLYFGSFASSYLTVSSTFISHPII